MQTAIDQFRVNIARARNLGSLAITLNAQTTDALDLSDMLRAEIALAVSALDYFVHEIARLGMLEIHEGGRQSTTHYQRFQISMSSVVDAISDPDDYSWLEREIITQHSRASFQNYDNIADAIRLFYGKSPWPEVSDRIGLEVQEVKETLNLIVDRRNKIVHEADMMRPSYLGARYAIDWQTVEDSITFIERITDAVYETVALSP